jgi:hypothetical protein
VSRSRLRLAAIVVIAAALGSGPGCPQRAAWSQDESRRIDEVVRAERFSDDLPEMKGTTLSAPESTAPALPTKDYAIQNTQPKNRGKPHRGSVYTQAKETGTSKTSVRRSGQSSARHKREEGLTANPAEAGSSSHLP